MRTIDRDRLQSLMQREQKKFVDERPKSKALFERARKSLPMIPSRWKKPENILKTSNGARTHMKWQRAPMRWLSSRNGMNSARLISKSLALP